MAWTAEVTSAAEGDLGRIYDHLIDTYLDVGYDEAEAVERADARIVGAFEGLRRLEKAPHRGTRHDIKGVEFRHTTIGRAVYWFRLDPAREAVIVEGIFHGGQDHLGRMLARLTAEGDG